MTMLVDDHTIEVLVDFSSNNILYTIGKGTIIYRML